MQEWMTALLQKRFENFLICVVVNNQSKIQLRQTVLDKIKLDFLTKYPNKLVVLSEPTRDTPKSRESWANFCDRVIEISLETMEIAFDQLNESVRQETIEIFRIFKTSTWNEYVFSWMSHPTYYVISLSPQVKWYVLIWFKYFTPLTCLKIFHFFLQNNNFRNFNPHKRPIPFSVKNSFLMLYGVKFSNFENFNFLGNKFWVQPKCLLDPPRVMSTV